MKKAGVHGLRFWLLAALGVVVIVAAQLMPLAQVIPPFWHHLVNEIGIAILVAGILALAVDRYLKQELAKDAVEAALGYLLPPSLRDEMQWLHEQKVICDKHTERITLTPFDSDAVIVGVKYDRVLENVSSEPCDVDISLVIDEWGHRARKSSIRSFGYETHKERVEGPFEVYYASGHTLATRAANITLKPGDKVTIWAEYEEVSGRNGHHLMTYRYPTLRPRVQVAAHSHLGFDVSFGHRTKFSPQRIGNDVWELNGLLLPTQYIRIVWWPSPAKT